VSVLPDYFAFEKYDSAQRAPVFRTTPCPPDACAGGPLQAVPSSAAANSSAPAATPASVQWCAFPRLNTPDNWLCGACESGYTPWRSHCPRCTGANGPAISGYVLLACALVAFFLLSPASAAGPVSILLFSCVVVCPSTLAPGTRAGSTRLFQCFHFFSRATPR